MKVRLGDLVKAMTKQNPLDPTEIPALVQFARLTTVPVPTIFRIRRIWKAAIKEFELYEDLRKALCEKYAKLNEERQEYIFSTPKKREQFEAEYNLMLQVDIELPGEPFTERDFGPRKVTSAEPFLSAEDLLKLEWLITDEEPAPKKAAAQAR